MDTLRWKVEIAKTLPSLLSGVILLVLGWIIGQRLTYAWNVKQKRREIQMAALEQFYSAYGEFFAVWKLWNRLESSESHYEEQRWLLQQRAASAEAKVESLIVKLSSEFKLSESQVSDLGQFRQNFQQLRECIRNRVLLDWRSSDEPAYVVFKMLTARVASLMSSEWSNARVPDRLAAQQLINVTSSRWKLNCLDDSTAAADLKPD